MNSQSEVVTNNINDSQEVSAALDTPKHTFCRIKLTKTNGESQTLRTKFMRMNNIEKLPSIIRKQLDTNLFNTFSKELRELDLFSVKNIEFIDEVQDTPENVVTPVNLD